MCHGMTCVESTGSRSPCGRGMALATVQIGTGRLAAHLMFMKKGTVMRSPSRSFGSSLLVVGLSTGVFMLAACVRTPGPSPLPSTTTASPSNVILTGRQEVPSVSTPATGSGAISILMDRSVSGSITTSGIAGTAAHIHLAPAGQNGPVIVSLTRTADNMWSVPPGVRLTDTQYDAFKQGNLYVNVHSAALPSGEIRGQMGQ